MLSAKIKAGLLKDFARVVNAVEPDDLAIRAGPDGLSILLVDGAHVLMVKATLTKDAFEEFKADEALLVFPASKLDEVLALANTEEIVQFDVGADDAASTLVFRVGNLVRRVRLVDPSAAATEPKMPNLVYEATIRFKAVAAILNGVRAAADVSDHLTLEMSPAKFRLSAVGDTDEVDLGLPKGADAIAEFGFGAGLGEKTVASSFDLALFECLVRAVPGEVPVKMAVGHDYPVTMEFEFADGDAKGIYLLAPRIEKE